MENDVHLIHLKRLGFKARKEDDKYIVEVPNKRKFEILENNIEIFVDGIHAGLCLVHLLAKRYGIKEKKEEK